MSVITLIDAGHGGFQRQGSSTPYGGRASNGLTEKELNLEAAEAVAAVLGSRAAMSRTSDVNLSLEERIQAARHARASSFVSLHVGEGIAGPEVWVHERAGAESLVLAHNVAQELGHTHEVSVPVRSAPLAVLHPDYHAGRPACLVEIADLETLAQMSVGEREERLGDVGLAVQRAVLMDKNETPDSGVSALFLVDEIREWSKYPPKTAIFHKYEEMLVAVKKYHNRTSVRATVEARTKQLDIIDKLRESWLDDQAKNDRKPLQNAVMRLFAENITAERKRLSDILDRKQSSVTADAVQLDLSLLEVELRELTLRTSLNMDDIIPDFPDSLSSKLSDQLNKLKAAVLDPIMRAIEAVKIVFNNAKLTLEQKLNELLTSNLVDGVFAQLVSLLDILGLSSFVGSYQQYKLAKKAKGLCTELRWGMNRRKTELGGDSDRLLRDPAHQSMVYAERKIFRSYLTSTFEAVLKVVDGIMTLATTLSGGFLAPVKLIISSVTFILGKAQKMYRMAKGAYKWFTGDLKLNRRLNATTLADIAKSGIADVSKGASRAAQDTTSQTLVRLLLRHHSVLKKPNKGSLRHAVLEGIYASIREELQRQKEQVTLALKTTRKEVEFTPLDEALSTVLASETFEVLQTKLNKLLEAESGYDFIVEVLSLGLQLILQTSKTVTVTLTSMVPVISPEEILSTDQTGKSGKEPVEVSKSLNPHGLLVWALVPMFRSLPTDYDA